MGRKKKPPLCPNVLKCDRNLVETLTCIWQSCSARRAESNEVLHVRVRYENSKVIRLLRISGSNSEYRDFSYQTLTSYTSSDSPQRVELFSFLHVRVSTPNFRSKT